MLLEKHEPYTAHQFTVEMLKERSSYPWMVESRIPVQGWGLTATRQRTGACAKGTLRKMAT